MLITKLKAKEAIDALVNGGMEYRRSRSASAKEFKNPLLDATLDYHPFTTTKVNFTYGRSVNGSYYIQDQVTTSSDWSVRLEQRLLGHFFLSAKWNHRESAYEAVTTTVPPPPSTEVTSDPAAASDPSPILVSLPGRKDAVDLFHARLTVQFLQRLTFAATFQKSRNDSSQAGYSFSSKQYGFELSCRY